MKDNASERRRDRDLAHSGYVSFRGASLGCIVQNISAEGAEIEVGNAAHIPERFRLVTAEGVRVCRMVWIKQNQIGVTFDDDGPTP